MIQKALDMLLNRYDLDEPLMTQVMQLIMQGEATPAQIAGFLIALRMKGETVTEIAAAANVMRALSSGVQVALPNMVDTCGTGGDGLQTFNISTTVAFVAAAAGAQVAKHGNRSVSSSSGSADVLREAGVHIELSPEQVARCVETLGVGFMFAPMHHSAMRHAVGPRKELGVYTLFNLLGPLTNPAGVENQVLGVYSKSWLEPMAQVLQQLGSRHVMVVHAADGLDEISPAGETFVAELKEGQLKRYSIHPEMVGLTEGRLVDIQINHAAESWAMMQSVFAGDPGTALTTVLLNAGAAIYVSGVASSWQAGVEMAQDAVVSGLAKEKFKEYREMTKIFRDESVSS